MLQKIIKFYKFLSKILKPKLNKLTFIIKQLFLGINERSTAGVQPKPVCFYFENNNFTYLKFMKIIIKLI